MKALYTFRENRDLAMLTWRGLETTSAMNAGLKRFIASMRAEMFGEIDGIVRVATGSTYEPSIETCTVSELDSHLRADVWLVDAKLSLQPTVEASDGVVELLELDDDGWSLGEVPLRQAGSRWSIVGRPAKVRDESLLFADVDFDPPGEGGVMIAWFRTKTDLWLADGLDGEPTGPDQRANRELLIAALRDVAARTDATLNLRELAHLP